MKNLNFKFNNLILVSAFLFSLISISCKKDENCNGNNTITQTDTLYDVKDGLIAYYNFDGGNLNDSSGFHNNITENFATPTLDRHGMANSAYLFNGSSSYMRIPNNATLTPLNMTISAIFRIDGFFSGNCHGNEIVSKGYPDGVAGNYLMRFNDHVSPCSGPFDVNNETIATGLQGAICSVDSIKVKTGIWYHCVYTFDGMNARVYINGKLKHQQSASVSYASNNYDLLIGKYGHPQYPYYFNGAIDEIRIYDRALSANMVRQLYDDQK